MKPLDTQILLVDCPDETGLVYRVTGVLYRHALNVVSNDEFVERETARFFMRTEFAGACDPAQIVAELRSALPATATVRLAAQRRCDIVILVSKEAHCLGDLLVRYAYGELNANIRAVISNHALLASLAHKFDIPFHHISADGLDRDAHEQLVLQAIAPYEPEYLVLAKYMRVLTPTFVAQFRNRTINIHHSFLPAFIGANPYGQAFRRGVKIIGATAHFVSNDLDEGPIIAQDVVRVDHSYSAAEMAQAGRDVEKIVLARALALALDERIFVNGNKTVIFD